ncbi:AsmA-like C-terminal region-containing protein [Celerinatantimonas yamalensis]|uniref:AsmA-like C-terminal region-containing protein n=1 Tax=Celerinatantimonas yamalensis TaxID=559956 RepID=A0ABW9GBD3_9GAMM
MRLFRDILAIFVLLLVAALTFVIFAFNPDRYQAQIEQWAATQGWQLRYQRSFWQISSPFSWHLDHVVLARRGVMTLSADQLDLSLSPKALFSRQLDISQLNLNQAQFKMALQPAAYQLPQLPWIKHIQVQQLNLKQASLSWLKPDGKTQLALNNADLQLSHWQIERSGTVRPTWRLRGVASDLDYNGDQLSQPQWSIQATGDQRWRIENASFQWAQGQIRASGQLHQQQLQLSDVAIDNVKYQPAQLSAALLPHWPAGIHSLQIDHLELNGFNLQSTLNNQPLVLNNISGSADQLHIVPQQPSLLSGNFSLSVNNLLVNQLPVQQFQLTGQLNGQSAELSQFSGQLQPGTFQASLNYQWQGKTPQLNIQSAQLDNATLSLSTAMLAETKQWLQRWPLTVAIDQANIDHGKLFAYFANQSLSIPQLTLTTSHITPLKAGHWQTIAALWQPKSSLFIQAPNLAYQGVVFSNVSADMGPNDKQPITQIHLYGELPQGQLQWDGTLDPQTPGKPWQGKLSALILDVSPLAQFTGNAGFKLGGDLELTGQLNGELGSGFTQLQGQLHATSTQLAFNRDLTPLLKQLLNDPKTTLPAHRQLLIDGVSALWNAPNAIPEGTTVFNQLQLNAHIDDGVLQLDQTNVASSPYNWLLSGQIDLASHQYNALGIGITDGRCVLLNRIVDGPWDNPQIRIDHYQLAQSYLPQRDQFISDSQSSGVCNDHG